MIIAERVFASLVIPKMPPISSIPCELAIDPVGFRAIEEGNAIFGPVVMVFGCAPLGTDIVGKDDIPVWPIGFVLEDMP